MKDALDMNLGSRWIVPRMSDLPIACSLSAADVGVRTADMARLGRDLVAVRRDGAAAELRFAPGHAGALRALAAAEAECCPFLTLDIRGDAVLTVSGPADAAPVVDELVAAFEGGRA